MPTLLNISGKILPPGPRQGGGSILTISMKKRHFSTIQIFTFRISDPTIVKIRKKSKIDDFAGSGPRFRDFGFSRLKVGGRGGPEGVRRGSRDFRDFREFSGFSAYWLPPYQRLIKCTGPPFRMRVGGLVAGKSGLGVQDQSENSQNFDDFFGKVGKFCRFKLAQAGHFFQ